MPSATSNGENNVAQANDFSTGPTSNSTGARVKSRRPANTAFKQQRLKAWQPILTPKTVLPTFFIIGILFIPLGIVFYLTSESVQELMFDYTDCKDLSESSSSFTAVSNRAPLVAVKYDTASNLCTVRFEVKSQFVAPVFLYYRLTNFFQNHRRYVRSLNTDQLLGEAVDAKSIQDSCSPLGVASNLPSSPIYYPCGLIANSFFNDTFGVQNSQFTAFTMAKTATSETYQFSEEGISWPSDAQKYGPTKYNLSEIAPPKDWLGFNYRGTVINGTTWADVGSVFNPVEDEHFQVWMRTAGLPTFRKLYGRNLKDNLEPGTYELEIVDVFPVKEFDGTKSVVISTTSWLGGKNPFLGIAYMTVGTICLIVGILFLVKHVLKPRQLGDHRYLSWNQNNMDNNAAGVANGGAAGDNSGSN